MFSSRFRALAGLSALMFAAPFIETTPAHMYRGSHTYNRRGWGSHPVAGGGEKERARRRRQIEAGSLKRDNGLDPELSARLGDYRKGVA